MAENSGEKNPVFQRKPTRRKFLGDSAKIAAGAVGLFSASSLVRSMTLPSNGRTKDSSLRVTTGEIAEAKEIAVKESLFSAVFNNLDENQERIARAEVDKFKAKIHQKEDFYREHMFIPRKYERVLRETAVKYGLKEELLIGVISIENGGGEDITNENSGARGVGQFMEDAGKRYGLIRDGIDSRGDPVKSIKASGEYLAKLKDFFGGDNGLAIWGYHAGEGNAMQALRIYFLNTLGEDVGDYQAVFNKDAVKREKIESRIKELIVKHKVSVHKVFSNKATFDGFVSKLDDYSSTYPYQAVAAAELFGEEKGKISRH